MTTTTQSVREKIEKVIEEIESVYPCQGSANHDGRYTDQIMTLFSQQEAAIYEKLKNEYEEVQKELDKKYGERVHSPHYMGILEAKLEALRKGKGGEKK